jgi:transcriptional regulator with XRE-family HTH domain
MESFGERMDFAGLLARAGITKAELARRLGISANAVSKWGANPPRYAVAYLELLIEFNRVRP